MHRNRLMMHAKRINFPPDPNQRSGPLPDPILIRSLSAFSLAKEDQVNENAQHHHSHDYLLQVFGVKKPRRNCTRRGSTMTAMVIDDGKRVAAGRARLKWHYDTNRRHRANSQEYLRRRKWASSKLRKFSRAGDLASEGIGIAVSPHFLYKNTSAARGV